MQYASSWARSWQIPDEYECAIDTRNVNVAKDEYLIQSLAELVEFVND